MLYQFGKLHSQAFQPYQELKIWISGRDATQILLESKFLAREGDTPFGGFQNGIQLQHLSHLKTWTSSSSIQVLVTPGNRNHQRKICLNTFLKGGESTCKEGGEKRNSSKGEGATKFQEARSDTWESSASGILHVDIISSITSFTIIIHG